jgi:alpha-ketoglutarate-dependent dioxygenase FTO
VWSILARSKSVLGKVHRKNLKQMQSEMALQDEIEFEWVRQFYIQGQLHYDLHRWWHAPIAQLVQHWDQLEGLTQAYIHSAAEHLRRSAVGGQGKTKGVDWTAEAIGSLKELLAARAKKREGWEQRGRDWAYRSLPPVCHPVPPPLFVRAPPSGKKKMKGKKQRGGSDGGDGKRSAATAVALAAALAHLG